jgi:DNA-binding transcriptional ArsR family regulator
MSPRAGEPAVATADVFAALGDGTRLRLVYRLSAEGPQSITHLSANEKVTRQAVTKHLRVLAQAGVARSSRVGREAVWQLDPAKLLSARADLERISAEWDVALARLQQFVEGQSNQPEEQP